MAAQPSHSYIPIEQDELFQLDLPTMGEYVLYLPKEGEALVECQDRFALNAYRGRYAIADGVSGSFAPGPWARIVAHGFVEYAVNTSLEEPEVFHESSERNTSYSFGHRMQFEQWLRQCCHEWYQWMRERWVPTMNVLHESSPINWDIEIEQGAQTTLTGCWLLPHTDPSNPYIDILVSIIGDSEFFLFRRDEQEVWQNVGAAPFTSASEFDSYPPVLATKPKAELIERAWNWHQEFLVSALPGDRIVLATDTLAKWIIMQLQYQMTTWTLLLDSTDAALHEQMLRQELHANRMEDDDLTMLVIPISSSRSEISK